MSTEALEREQAEKQADIGSQTIKSRKMRWPTGNEAVRQWQQDHQKQTDSKTIRDRSDTIGDELGDIQTGSFLNKNGNWEGYRRPPSFDG